MPSVQWYWFCAKSMRYFFFPLFGGFKVKHDERVPKTGATIIAPVHFSYLDPPAMGGACPRHMAVMGKAELFGKPIIGPLIKSLGVFPVDRGAADRKAMVYSLEVLREGRALLMFPEGTRGDGVTLGKVEHGVITFAKKTDAKIVPVGIIGTEKVLPRNRNSLKRAKTTIVFGEPFTYAEYATGANEKENLELVSIELERRLIELCAAEGLNLKSSRNSNVDSK